MYIYIYIYIVSLIISLLQLTCCVASVSGFSPLSGMDFESLIPSDCYNISSCSSPIGPPDSGAVPVAAVPLLMALCLLIAAMF